MKKSMTLNILMIFLSLACYAQVDIPDSLLTAPEIKAFIKGGDVFVSFPNGPEKQLTFTKTNEKPFMLKSTNEVLFFRNEKILKGDFEYTRKKIMKVDINTFLEETISEQKPFKDGKDNTYEILNIENPCLSLDETSLYFLTAHTATTNQLIRLDLSTGKWNQLFSAESFELLRSGPFTGYFLIGQYELGPRGKGIYYYLLDGTGKRFKEFDSKESMQQFKEATK
jgi:hypothetical protein